MASGRMVVIADDEGLSLECHMQNMSKKQVYCVVASVMEVFKLTFEEALQAAAMYKEKVLDEKVKEAEVAEDESGCIGDKNI